MYLQGLSSSPTGETASFTVTGFASTEEETRVFQLLFKNLGGPISLTELLHRLRKIEEPVPTERVLVTLHVADQPVAQRVVIEHSVKQQVTLETHIGLAPMNGRVTRFPVHVPVEVVATVLP